LPPLVVAGAEVVVVDVEGDPDVGEVVASAGVLRLPTTDNVGYAAAVNRGVAAASRPIVVFLNDDVRADAPAVAALAAIVDAGEADVAVPRVVDATGALEPTVAAVPTLGRVVLEWCVLPDAPVPALQRLHVEKWRRPTNRERIEAAAAVVVACRRDLLVATPLPEAYFLYWEESEWFLRLQRAGRTVVYEPGAAVGHDGGRDDVRPDKDSLLTRNCVRCVRRTQGRWAALAVVPPVLFWRLRLLVMALALPSRRPLVRARAAGMVAALASPIEALRRDGEGP
jgi:GT2 family glycosyltransferase